jgi:hypothetical protein
MALALAPLPSGRRARPAVRPATTRPGLPTTGGATPARPYVGSEPGPRRHHPRPTRGGCVVRGSDARRRAVARRQRVLLGTVATGLLVALALPWGGTGGHALATPGPALVGEVIRPHAQYIVRPGDTLWTIAEHLDPSGDPRSVVARLEAQVGGDTVVPGERLTLP